MIKTVGRGIALVLGVLFVGVVTPLVAFVGTVFANSEGEIWAVLLVYAMIPLGIGLALLSGALRRSPNVRITVGALLAGVLAPLGAVLSFGPVGSDLGGGFMEPPTWTYPLHDAFLTLIPATVVPAALGVLFILSGARPHQAWRARLTGCAAAVVTGVGVALSLFAGYGDGPRGRCVVVKTHPPACVSYPDVWEVGDLVVNPQHPQTVYVADNAGAMFKSTDGGVDWSRLDPWGGWGVFAVMLDPQRPDTVYVGAYNGFYRSTDGGSSWMHSLNGQEVELSAIAPQGGALYVDVSNGVGGSFRPFRSTDGGTTWHRFRFPGRSPRFFSDMFDPYHPQWRAGHTDAPGYSSDTSSVAFSRRAAFVTGRDGVYEKANTGTTWQLVARGGNLGPIAVSADGRVLYAGAGGGSNSYGPVRSRVYRFRLRR